MFTELEIFCGELQFPKCTLNVAKLFFLGGRVKVRRRIQKMSVCSIN